MVSQYTCHVLFFFFKNPTGGVKGVFFNRKGEMITVGVGGRSDGVLASLAAWPVRNLYGKL